MTLPNKAGLSVEESTLILKTVGLWMDLDLKNRVRDRWGWFITTEKDYMAYETRTAHNEHMGGHDHLRSRGSTIACHDGDEVIPAGDWRPCGAGIEKRYYAVPRASFVLVETAGIPERVFLYLYSPRFNLKRVLSQLEEHRLWHPPRIFILEVTPEEKA